MKYILTALFSCQLLVNAQAVVASVRHPSQLSPRVASNAVLEIINCDPDEKKAVEKAWVGAQLGLVTMGSAIDGPLYDLFFGESSTSKRDMRKTISSVLNLEPHYGRAPSVVCATSQEIFQHYPRITPAQIDFCLSPTSLAQYIVEIGRNAYNTMFLCGEKFFARTPPSLPSPSTQSCPTVIDNIFDNHAGFPQTQSLFIMMGLTSIYSYAGIPLHMNRWGHLNAAIKRRALPTGVNWGALSYSK